MKQKIKQFIIILFLINLFSINAFATDNMNIYEYHFSEIDKYSVFRNTKENSLNAITAIQICEDSLSYIHENLNDLYSLSILSFNNKIAIEDRIEELQELYGESEIDNEAINKELEQLEIELNRITYEYQKEYDIIVQEILNTCQQTKFNEIYPLKNNFTFYVPVGWPEHCHNNIEIHISDIYNELLKLQEFSIFEEYTTNEIENNISLIALERSHLGSHQNSLSFLVELCDEVIQNGPLMGNEFEINEITGEHLVIKSDGIFDEIYKNSLERIFELEMLLNNEDNSEADILSIQDEINNLNYYINYWIDLIKQENIINKEELSVYIEKPSTYIITIPKLIVLNQEKYSDYDIIVNGDCASNFKINVIPNDFIESENGINFYMEEISDSTIKKDNVIASIIQEETKWDYREIFNGTRKSGRIIASDLSSGYWKGICTFNIIPEENISLENEIILKEMKEFKTEKKTKYFTTIEGDRYKLSIILPKWISLNENGLSEYEVNVNGNVQRSYSVEIKPENSIFSMNDISSQDGKDNIEAIITQNDINWNYQEINEGTIKKGIIDAKNITAGLWEGKINFIITMKDACVLDEELFSSYD